MALAVLIEDDPAVTDLVQTLLHREGFDVHVAPDAEKGVELVRELEPQFVVLDHELPGVNGQEACRRIRTFTDAYVIMLTGRADEIDKIISFGVGADDYITKPFSPRELVTRLHAMKRRPRTTVDAAASDPDKFVLDERSSTAQAQGITVGFTPTEFTLIQMLHSASPEVVHRSDMTRSLWGVASNTHVLDVHLSNIRRKLKNAGINPDCIQVAREGALRLLPPQALS